MPTQVVAAALAKAKKTHKLLLIDVGGNWCPDCVVLDNLMLVPAMQKFMDAHYVVAMVDVGQFDRNPQIAARFGYTERLKGVPTILVVIPRPTKWSTASRCSRCPMPAIRRRRTWRIIWRAGPIPSRFRSAEFR